ncbi:MULTISPECIES: hypothetical protein [unclassified Knoellia]|uniref:hypothetical protein n=1 Tax=Knoellia altitudinis TaxID=3404795 RepID=UPI0036121304
MGSLLGGEHVPGTHWDRFGKYNAIALERADGAILAIRAHAGELVPGSTEDLLDFLKACNGRHPVAPFTLELDPTYACSSVSCGGACFSAAYRSLRPKAQISEEAAEAAIRAFAHNGGRVVRFDGGGDPLMHEGVRSGRLVVKANELGLRTTILTSGDLLHRSSWEAIIDSDCYLRVSLNAATTPTRREIHGNKVDMAKLWAVLARISQYAMKVSGPPVGATFLLTAMNYHEVAEAARMARDAGIRHFSVRRVLGPDQLRPQFTTTDLETLPELLADARGMSNDDFVVFTPFREVNEPDLSPQSGQIAASSCWQSTFKTVMEPADQDSKVRVQLCGRYRGDGVGQVTQLPAIATSAEPSSWVSDWRNSFHAYPHSRPSLLRKCTSCIDRGFIEFMEALIEFTEMGSRAVNAEHFYIAPQDLGRLRGGLTLRSGRPST